MQKISLGVKFVAIDSNSNSNGHVECQSRKSQNPVPSGARGTTCTSESKNGWLAVGESEATWNISEQHVNHGYEENMDLGEAANAADIIWT